MTIKQLILELSKLDDNLLVVTCGYEGGYNNCDSLQEISIVHDNYDEKSNSPATWYYGEYSDYEPNYHTNYPIVKAVLL